MQFFQLANVAWKVLEYKILKKRTPISVSYISTYRCNQKCAYCDWTKVSSEEMDTENALKFISDMKESGVIKIGFAGGESLTRPDIEQLIRHAHKCGLIISVSSNGRLIEKYLDVIKECVSVVQISLDGTEEIHDLQRGNGSYKCVIDSIELLHKHNVKMITNTVLTKNNKEEIDFVLKIAEKYNHQALIQPVFTYGLSECEEKINDTRLGTDEMQEVIEYLKKCKRKHRPLANSTSFLNYIKKSWNNQKIINCSANKLFCTVDPKGNILPCCFCDSELCDTYNVSKLGFKKAYEVSKDNNFSDNCNGCYCNAYMEMNLAFAFNISACLNAMNIV